MRRLLILLILILIGTTVPALADRDYGNHGNRHEYGKRFDSGHQNYARHDRGDNYRHFKKRMRHLRKELRHERRENARLERREERRYERRWNRYQVRYERRYRGQWSRVRPVITYPRVYGGWYFPSILGGCRTIHDPAANPAVWPRFQLLFDQ